MPDIKNYGLVLEPPRATDWWLGGISGITRTVIRPDGDWRPFLPPIEIQRTPSFDTMACVTFSALNCIETIIKAKYGADVNLSDRFIAKLSGTTSQGNSFYNVAEAIKKFGDVLDGKWPFDGVKTFAEYYAEIPQWIVDLAKELLVEYDIRYEFVWDTPDKLLDALRYAPVQIAIHAYGTYDKASDRFLRTDGRGNHAVSLINAVPNDHWLIFDHYEWAFKKLAWDSRLWGALCYYVEKKNPTPPPMSTYKFEEGHRYFVADGLGGTIFMLAGKLRLDDLAKCNDQWLGRIAEGDGQIKGKSHTITLKELEGVHLYDLKGNDLGLAKDKLGK